MIEKRSLSQIFENLSQKSKIGEITIQMIIDEMGMRSHFLFVLLFALPFLLPVPLPGLSTVFGAVIGLVGIQVIFNLDIWVPDRWRRIAIPSVTGEKLFRQVSRMLVFVEKFLKTRWWPFFDSMGLRLINGILLLILALLLALPMPPGFNAPPAFAICLLSLGYIERDGLAILCSWIATILNIALFSSFFLVGWKVLEKVTNLY